MADSVDDDAYLSELLESALADFNGSHSDQSDATKSSDFQTAEQHQTVNDKPPTAIQHAGTEVSPSPKLLSTEASSDPNECAEKLAAELLGGLGGLCQPPKDKAADNNAEEFISRLESQISNLDSTMRSLLQPSEEDGADPSVSQMKAELRRLVENVDKTEVNSPEDLKDISKTMQETLQKLNEDIPNAQSSQTAASSNSSDPLAPFMEQMLSALLSREVLYVPLKGITEKYPSWIDENAASLPPGKESTYRQQLNLMNEVCREFENTTCEPNTMKIFELVQKMQELGPPPEELVSVGDDNSLIPPVLSGDSNNCPTM